MLSAAAGVRLAACMFLVSGLPPGRHGHLTGGKTRVLVSCTSYRANPSNKVPLDLKSDGESEWLISCPGALRKPRCSSSLSCGFFRNKITAGIHNRRTGPAKFLDPVHGIQNKLMLASWFFVS